MKNCLMCGESFSGKRKDSLYCSNSCKAKYFELKKKNQLSKNSLQGLILQPLTNQNKSNTFSDSVNFDHITEHHKVKTVDMEDLTPFDNIIDDGSFNESKLIEPIKETTKPMSSLDSKSIVNSTNGISLEEPEQYSFKLVKVNNPNYQDCVARLKVCRAGIAEYKQNITKMQLLLTQLTNKFHKDLVGRWMDYEVLNTEYQQQVQKINKIIKDCQNIILMAEKEEKSILFELPNYPAQLEKEEKVVSLVYTYWKLQQPSNPSHKQHQVKEAVLSIPVSEPVKQAVSTEVQNESPKKETTDEPSDNFENHKVSSMKKIAGMKFQLLNFKDKWFDFFGSPQTNFFCVVHGMSGEGKTNFSIQFAKYLAESFGNVLYISGEEGFAPTFQQKIKALGADTIPRLYAADIRTGQEILTEIDNKYHFIVIDSVNNMDIDPDMMKAIRNKFRKSGIIAICQSTKDGKIRGSYQIVHDSDMAVRVSNGIAITTKNRFKEKHQEFNVFEVYGKPKLSVVKKLGGTDHGDDLIFKNTI